LSAGTDDELTPESTVADLLTHWIATCRADTAPARTNGARPGKTEDTLDAYARVIDKVLIPALRACGRVNSPRSESPRYLRSCTPVSAARDSRTVLSQACKMAVAYGALDHSPVAAAYTPLRSAPKPRALTPADAVEMRRRIVAWQGGGSKLGPACGYDRLRVLDVLLATGARIGEVLALTWDDIHRLGGDGPVQVYIGHRLDKKPHRVIGRKAGGDPYTVTIPEFGAAALREQRALGIPVDPVFPTRRGTHQSEANVRTHWRAIRGEHFK
jgi:integrase